MPIGEKRERTRTTPYKMGPVVKTGTLYVFSNGKWVKPPAGADYSVSVLPTWQYQEYCVDERHAGPPYTTGGPFLKMELSSDSGVLQGNGSYDSGTDTLFFTGFGFCPWKYVGGFCNLVYPSSPSFLADYTNLAKFYGSNFHIPSTDGFGPTVWAKSAPKIEMASGFVFLAESRDLPRMLKQTASDFHFSWKALGGKIGPANQLPRKASDSFLNHQFGWSPFLGDLGKFLSAFEHHNEYMDRMTAGNGNWKLVRRTVLDDHSSTKIASGEGRIYEPILPNGGSQLLRPGKVATWELREEINTLVTSSGRFKWYRPEFDKSSPSFNAPLTKLRREMALYGLRVNPSNIWRATPWTWLIDWGINMGRNIDRMQEYLLDGVICQYLYLMHHKERKLVLTCTIPFRSGDVTLKSERHIDVKQRKEAGSPYGLDLPWANLTPRKLAILAALGISRKSFGVSPA